MLRLLDTGGFMMDDEKLLINSLNDVVKSYLYYLQNNGRTEELKKMSYLFKNDIKDINEYSLFEKDDVYSNNVLDKLSDVIEYGSNKKKNGVYYTPKDVIEFMSLHSVYQYLFNDNPNISIEELTDKILDSDKNKLMNFCLQSTILDPTSGAGEFTLFLLKLKIRILTSIGELNSENVLKCLETIYNNDLSRAAIISVKYRYIIYLFDFLEINDILKAIEIIEKNTSEIDFVFNSKSIDLKNIDIVIGNPPYVEYRFLTNKPVNKFGNIYADVLKNSLQYLNDRSIICFVIPISFVATPRMKGIRSLYFNKFNKLSVYSFSDRPDSLFSNVHQKLNIIIGLKDKKLIGNHLYTSKYNYFYKEERKILLDDIELVNNTNFKDDFIPKYGNILQKNIFKKVTDTNNNFLLDVLKKFDDIDNNNIYLSSRVSFFTKCFINGTFSKEYKKFKVLKINNNSLMAILNSTTFWMYWVMVSDGWHITNKELSNFALPIMSDIEMDRLAFLGKKLSKKLEETKEYIGTVQSDYAYKHKYCFDIIDEIDIELSRLYGFTNDELKEVLSFERKYRGGF